MALNTNIVAPSGSRVFFTSDGGLNYWGYSDPKVDELFKRVTSKEALDTNCPQTNIWGNQPDHCR